MDSKYVVRVLAGMLAGAVMGLIYTKKNHRRETEKVSRRAEAFASALDEKISQKFDEFLIALEDRERSREAKNQLQNGYYPIESDVF